MPQDSSFRTNVHLSSGGIFTPTLDDAPVGPVQGYDSANGFSARVENSCTLVLLAASHLLKPAASFLPSISTVQLSESSELKCL